MVNTNKIRQLLASAVILAGVALGITIALKMYREKVPAPLAAGRFPAADVSLQKIHYTETKQGKKCWDLVADTANYNKDGDVTSLSGVRLVVAGNGETGDITLVADRADYHNTSGDVQLSGNVKARSGSGLTFSTSSAGYVAARSTIETSDPVHFSNGMLAVQGVGMEMMVDARTVKINHQVTATCLPGKSKK